MPRKKARINRQDTLLRDLRDGKVIMHGTFEECVKKANEIAAPHLLRIEPFENPYLKGGK